MFIALIHRINLSTFGIGFRDVRFGPKMGQIAPKSDKSGTLSVQILVHFDSLSQNILKSDLKNHIFVPFEPNLTYFSQNLATVSGFTVDLIC